MHAFAKRFSTMSHSKLRLILEEKDTILEKPRGILKFLFAQNRVILGVISTEFYYTKE